MGEDTMIFCSCIGWSSWWSSRECGTENVFEYADRALNQVQKLVGALQDLHLYILLKNLHNRFLSVFQYVVGGPVIGEDKTGGRELGHVFCYS